MAEDALKKQQAKNITASTPVNTSQTVYRKDAEGNDASYTIAGNQYTVDQETTNQLVLDEAAAAQTRLNMMTAADEDKYLKTHFTSEEMRAADAASLLKQDEYATMGVQDRLTEGVKGVESRARLETEGAEQRDTAKTVGAQTRLTEVEKGAQERKTQAEGLQESGKQQRQTQAESFMGQRGLETVKGEEARALVGKTASEGRQTQAER